MPTGQFEDASLSGAWQFEGDSNWILDNGNSNSGNSSARSGSINDNESSEMSLSANIAEDGEISFYKKVSSEASYDYLQFYIDDQMMDQWAGDISWGQETYSVEAGFRTFRWNYFKDVGVSSGSDCAWVDDIVFPPIGVSDINDNYELSITNYELKQNYPNPFNPITKINYELGGILVTNGITNYELAEIVVFNAMGQEVWSQNLSTDYALRVTGSVLFDGSMFNSGVYYYSLVVDDKKLNTKAMILIK